MPYGGFSEWPCRRNGEKRAEPVSCSRGAPEIHDPVLGEHTGRTGRGSPPWGSSRREGGAIHRSSLRVYEVCPHFPEFPPKGCPADPQFLCRKRFAESRFFQRFLNGFRLVVSGVAQDGPVYGRSFRNRLHLP